MDLGFQGKSVIVTGGGSNMGRAIVSISADASRQGEPREAVYGGVKAAVNSFMKTIARENGRFGIRCNAVCPGVTISESDDEVGAVSMWANREAMFAPDQLERARLNMPLRKIGRSRDIANAVAFLVSRFRNSRDRISGSKGHYLLESSVIQLPKFGTINVPNFGTITLDQLSGNRDSA